MTSDKRASVVFPLLHTTVYVDIFLYKIIELDKNIHFGICFFERERDRVTKSALERKRDKTALVHGFDRRCGKVAMWPT